MAVTCRVAQAEWGLLRGMVQGNEAAEHWGDHLYREVSKIKTRVAMETIQHSENKGDEQRPGTSGQW